MIHIKEIVEEVLANEEEVLTAGLKFLDENLGGLYPGELTVICGGADCEKSALMIRQISSLALDKKTPVLMVLNGTNKRIFLICLAAYYCNVVTEDVRRLLNDIYYRNVFNACLSSLNDSPLYIMEKSEFVSRKTDLQSFVEEQGIRAIFIENGRWLFRGKVKPKLLGQTLKQLAKKLNVVVVVEYGICIFGPPTLSEIQKFNDDDIFEFADNIINLVDFTARRIHVDEHGYDLRGLVGLRILKHKGEQAKCKETRYRRTQLLASNSRFAINLHKDVAKRVIQSNESVSKLISAFDCKLVTDPKDDEEI